MTLDTHLSFINRTTTTVSLDADSATLVQSVVSNTTPTPDAEKETFPYVALSLDVNTRSTGPMPR